MGTSTTLLKTKVSCKIPFDYAVITLHFCYTTYIPQTERTEDTKIGLLLRDTSCLVRNALRVSRPSSNVRSHRALDKTLPGL